MLCGEIKMCEIQELEKLRKELEQMIQSKGIGDEYVLELSQKLDLYIVQYYDNY
jgi:hypothetical protein